MARPARALFSIRNPGRRRWRCATPARTRSGAWPRSLCPAINSRQASTFFASDYGGVMLSIVDVIAYDRKPRTARGSCRLHVHVQLRIHVHDGRKPGVTWMYHRHAKASGHMEISGELAAGRLMASVTRGRGRGPGGQLAALPLRAGCCPVPGCGERIDPTRLMCRRDWYLVPREVRDQVWATWRSGQGAFAQEHQAAVLRAISGRAAAGKVVAAGPAQARTPS